MCVWPSSTISAIPWPVTIGCGFGTEKIVMRALSNSVLRPERPLRMRSASRFAL